MDQGAPSSPDQDKAPEQAGGLGRFWAELKRRKVMRVAITYAIASIAIIEFASATFGYFDIPDWAFRLITLCVVLGFPIAVIIAWAFELTPEGIKTTKTAFAERVDADVSEKQQRKRNWLAYVVGAAVPTIILGTILLIVLIQERTPEPIPEATFEDTEKSIAVLPLTNMSPDPENAFFADGVHEDILTNLSKIEELLVISRTSTLGYKETTKKLKEIGEELNVRYLVEGSVRRAGNQVLVTAQLIDVETDAHLWAENFNRPLDDIFAIQADIAKAIADQLRAVISPETIDRIEYRPTESPEAYDYWVKHRQAISAINRRGWDEKIELLENALEHDPKFAEAWAHLAIERFVQWGFKNSHDDPELLAQAYRDFDVAKKLKPEMAYIPYVEVFIAQEVERDYAAMIEAALRALAIDPSFHGASRKLGQAYNIVGRLAEAQHTYESTLRLDPLSPVVNNSLGKVYLQRRMWGKARTLLNKNLERDASPDWRSALAELNYLQYGNRQAYLDELKALPHFDSSPSLKARHALFSRDFPSALEFLKSSGFEGGILSTGLTRSLLAWSSGASSKADASADAARRAAGLKKTISENVVQHPRSTSALSIYLALAGKRDEMKAAISQTRELARNEIFEYRHALESEIRIAIGYIVLGDDEKAIETLEAASKMDGPIFLNRELDLWFIFDRLRGDPRFEALLED